MTLVKRYERKIEEAKTKNDIKDIIMNISFDCSNYKLSWEEFMKLRKAAQEKGYQLGFPKGYWG